MAVKHLSRSFSLRANRVPTLRCLASTTTAFSPPVAVSQHEPNSKYTLYDIPVSNSGARVRYVLYKKGLQSRFDVVAPQALGGLKSAEYLSLNPQGKMPLLVLPDGTALPESEVIVQYLLDKFEDCGPSLKASTPEGRARAALATRVHDLYITPIQGCMYRKMDSIDQRAREIAQLAYQLDVLEGLVAGPYIAGELTSADAALFPTMVFMNFMLPSFFGWQDIFAQRPKLRQWWRTMSQDPEAAKVIAEIEGGLKSWQANNRWRDQGILDHVANKQYKWAY